MFANLHWTDREDATRAVGGFLFMIRSASMPVLTGVRPAFGPIDHPLPAWVMAVPGVPWVVSRLGVTEFRRRLFHMLPAFLPIGLPMIPHSDIWEPWLRVGIFVSAGIAVIVAIAFRTFMTRESEQSWFGAVAGYMTPVLTAFVVFPGRAELALMTLQIVALGDGSATVGGMLFGKRRLPWNSHKSCLGLFCFVCIGSLAASYSYWGEANPHVSFGTAFQVCFTAALCAGIVESLPIDCNDNLRVGATALLVGKILSDLIV